MSTKKPNPSNGTTLPGKLKFDYLKSKLFRVIHADGVWGGVTPRGHIQMAFWNERPPIPRQVAYEVTEKGELGEEIKAERQARDAIVREVEVNVVLDLNTAKALLTWLQDKIKYAGEQGGDPEKLREGS